MPGVLADPQLVLYRANSPLWENDNWTANSSDINAQVEAARATGAFAFDPNSKDASIVVTLAPGSYTAVVKGAADTSGTALVEVYVVP